MLLLFLLLFLSSNQIEGQSIRKHYTQLTESERAAFVEALDVLYDLGVVDQYADLHADPDQDGTDGNNFNGPDTDSQIHRVSIFLPWHRQFTAEFERELQALNPKLSLPYWDWTGDFDPVGVNSRSAQSPLWSTDQIAALGWTGSLIGKYNAQKDLNRRLAGTLPTSLQKNNLLTSFSFNSFGNFRFELEVDLHDPPHSWIGGTMADMLISPKDPAFFIHHAMVDYLWQLWTEAGHSVDFFSTSMPTFDGSVSGFPLVDPDDIRNAVTQMGIFYANPDQDYLELRNYTVQNAHVPNENFIYPDSIIVSPSFQIGENAVAEIHACKGVKLRAGFHIPAGATVTIGTDAFCDSGQIQAQIAGITETESLESKERSLLKEGIPDRRPVTRSVTLKGFPNPFRQSFTFQFTLPTSERVSLVLIDALGRVVASPMPPQQRMPGEHELLVDARELPAGIYSAVLLLHDSSQRYVLRVVKAD